MQYGIVIKLCMTYIFLYLKHFVSCCEDKYQLIEEDM